MNFANNNPVESSGYLQKTIQKSKKNENYKMEKRGLIAISDHKVLYLLSPNRYKGIFSYTHDFLIYDI